MHDRGKIFLLSFIIIVISLPLVAGNISFDEVDFTETNKSRPTIQAVYDRDDAPIIITDYSMVNSRGEEIPINYTGNQARNEFNFTLNTQGSLFGKYVLQVIAKDDDGNSNMDYYGVDVRPQPMKIWVKKPKNTDFTKDQDQHIAVGNKIPFNLTLESETAAQCRIIKNSGLLEKRSSQELYDMGKRFNDANATYTRTHRIPVVTLNQPTSQTRLNVKSFDYNDHEAENQFLVICKEYKIDGEEQEFKRQLFHVGYDLTDPEFTINMTPPVIFDEANVKTTANINSEDDHLICSYDFMKNTEPKYFPEQYELEQTVDSIENYEGELSTTFDFSNKGTYEYETEYPYKVNFTCTNPAMRSTSKTASFKILLDRSFEITYEDNGYYSSTNPELHFKTRKEAECRYKFDTEEYETTEGDGKNHTAKLKGLDEGEYSIKLQCTSIGGEEKEETFDFTIDKTEPSNPQVISNEYNCEHRWAIDLEEPDETVFYNISLYNSTQTTKENRLHQVFTDYTQSVHAFKAPTNIPVEKNATYAWEVTAIDKAGLSSATTTHSTTGKPQDALVCDTDYPEASLEKTPSGNGFNVTISCSDGQSGCTDLYGYKQLTPGQNCSDTVYQDQSYNESIYISSETLLCYQVRDKAGHTTNESELFTTGLDIQISKPEFGIAPDKVFGFEATTKRKAACRHGPLEEEHPEDKNSWFETLENMSTDDGTTHTDSIAASDYEALDESKDEAKAQWIIICEEDGQNYHEKEFTLGYDTTPPEITLTADPNPITSAASQSTTLEAEVDDQVVCTFKDREGVPRGFDDYDPHSEESFRNEFSTVIDYWGFTQTVSQEVKCRNKAGLHATANEDIDITPENELGIKITTPGYNNENRIELMATTDDDASCSYKTSQENSKQEFQITGGTEHTKHLTLDEGSYTVGVYCEDSKGESSLAFKELVIDTTNPELEILSSKNTCSLEQIQGQVLANGTGSPISSYNYSINDDSSTVASGKAPEGNFTEELALMRGSQYMITAEATDKAGNSAQKTLAVTATPYSETDCDTTPPSAEAKVSYKWNYNEVTVECNDTQSGCSDYYTRKLTDESCIRPYDLEYYDSSPLHISDSGQFCYEVYDKAANSYKDEVSVTMKHQCFNGIEDPDENGVDCEGPCPAQCGTCDNGKQDPFEEGVDCGGICEHIESCSEKSQERDGCQNDEDCPYGQICNYEGECVEEPDEDDDKDPEPSPEEDEPDMLGIILLVAGILFFLGGGGYITYSRYEKYQLTKQQQTVMQQQIQQRNQQELAKKRQEQRRKLMEEIRKRKEQQNQARQQKVEERHKHRKSVVGAFEDSNEKKQPRKQDGTPDEEQLDESERQHVEEKVFAKKEEKQQSFKQQQEERARQAAKEEYKNIMDLKAKQKKESSVFDELQDVTSGSSSAPDHPRTTPYHQLQEQKPEEDSQKTALDELDSITNGKEEKNASEKLTTPDAPASPSGNALEELESLVEPQSRASKDPLLKELGLSTPAKRKEVLIRKIEEQAANTILDMGSLATSFKHALDQNLLQPKEIEDALARLAGEHTITEDQREELVKELASSQ